MPPKEDWEKYQKPVDTEEENDKNPPPLDEGDIELLKSYVSYIND